MRKTFDLNRLEYGPNYDNLISLLFSFRVIDAEQHLIYEMFSA